MKVVKSLLLTFLVTGCLDSKPVTNDSDVKANFLEIQNELSKLTAPTNPEQMEEKNFLVVNEKARFFTGEFQNIGYKTFEVLEKQSVPFELDDGSFINVLKFKTLESIFKISDAGDPVLDQRWERPCRFAPSPYNLWLETCELPQFHDYYLYYIYTTQDIPLFFNYSKKVFRTPLPPLMVENNNCFGNMDCTIEVSEVKFDIIQNIDGKRTRQNIMLWLTKDLPYLASNPKRCFSTMVEVEGKKYPYEYCQDLVNYTIE